MSKQKHTNRTQVIIQRPATECFGICSNNKPSGIKESKFNRQEGRSGVVMIEQDIGGKK